MSDVVILGGARTPFGTFGGALKDIPAIQLGAIAAGGALAHSGVAATDVDNVVFGNVLQTSTDALYMARHVGLKAGVPQEAPGLTVNRLCGSGLQAVVSAAQSIRLGESKVALAGGAENMSQAPLALYSARWGVRFGAAPDLQDTLWAALLDPHCGCTMAITAENLAKEFAISRAACDEFACRSQQAAAAARAAGRLAREIVPVPAGKITVTQDEHIRADVTLEALAALKARFVEGGVVTPGNASGINDGAAALILAGARQAEHLGIKPIGRIVAWGVAGVDPRVMGIGPVPASRLALDRAGLAIEDMDLVEINEAFAPQYLAVEKALRLDRRKTNVNGGAIALGHPLGASGARLALTLLTELRERGGRYGLASLCIGGGQGIAVIFEAL